VQKGLCREVGEDILLSENDGRNGSRNNGRAAWAKRSEREQDREMTQIKLQVLTKIFKKSGPLIIKVRGRDLNYSKYYPYLSSIVLLI
jgi:hypothetical protein